MFSKFFSNANDASSVLDPFNGSQDNFKNHNNANNVHTSKLPVMYTQEDANGNYIDDNGSSMAMNWEPSHSNKFKKKGKKKYQQNQWRQQFGGAEQSVTTLRCATPPQSPFVPENASSSSKLFDTDMSLPITVVSPLKQQGVQRFLSFNNV
jgi:hypothetical protein